jgi:hypothetical protein
MELTITIDGSVIPVLCPSQSVLWTNLGLKNWRINQTIIVIATNQNANLAPL